MSLLSLQRRFGTASPFQSAAVTKLRRNSKVFTRYGIVTFKVWRGSQDLSSFRRNRMKANGSQQFEPERRSSRPSPSKSTNWGRNQPALHPYGTLPVGTASSNHVGAASRGAEFVPTFR